MAGSTPAVSLKIRRLLKRESRFLKFHILEIESGIKLFRMPLASQTRNSHGRVGLRAAPNPMATIRLLVAGQAGLGRLDWARYAGQAGPGRLGWAGWTGHAVLGRLGWAQSTYSQHTVNIQSTHSQHNSQHVLPY